MIRAKAIQVALGQRPADIAILNGRIANVHTAEFYPADVAIADGIIAMIGDISHCLGKGTKVIDAAGYTLLPGFIDSHIHVESSLLSFSEFARVVLAHGTTTVASDLMEVAIVTGIEGIREMLKEAEGSPLKLFLFSPSHLLKPGLETIGGGFDLSDVKETLPWLETVGLAEIIVHHILATDDVLSEAIALTERARKTLEGHAPALTGKTLAAYLTAGIRSDHESTNTAEALEKVRSGMRLMIREGSVSTDLRECLKVITEHRVDPRHCLFVSDDVHVLDLTTVGHMDHKVRMAIEQGLAPMAAIQMATLNAAESLKVDDWVGSISPGRYADILLVKDMEKMPIDTVIAKGEVVVDKGQLRLPYKAVRYSPILRNTVKLRRPLEPDDFAVRVDRGAKQARVRVIRVLEGTLLKEAAEARLNVKEGVIQPDTNKDVLLISVVERYKRSGRVFTAFVSGFGLKAGAIASTVAHDHHNLTIVGTNPLDMAVAGNRLAETEGGLVAVRDGQVVSEVPLPVAGLMSDANAWTVAEQTRRIHEATKQLGCPLLSPYMSLSFAVLPFIPAYGITDLGLIDALKYEIVEPVLEVST